MLYRCFARTHLISNDIYLLYPSNHDEVTVKLMNRLTVKML